MDGINNGLVPIKRKKSLVEEVVEVLSTYILQGILNGDLQPGDKLPAERKLAEQLQIGRSTLREATQVLVILNLLEIKPGHGTYIADGTSEFNASPFSWGLILQQKSLNELVEMRKLLETECAFLAAERATKLELENIRKTFRKMEDMCKEQNAEGMVDADIEFHLEIALASHNNVLYQTLRTIRNIMQLWISKVFSGEKENLELTVEEHREILDAISNHNCDAAKEAMAKHIQRASIRLDDINSGL